MRGKWFLLLFVLCVMLIITGCGTVSDREVKTRYGVTFISVDYFLDF